MKLLLFLFFFSLCAHAQEFKLVSSEKIEADTFIGIDSYKHTYFLKNGALFKKGDLGEFSFQDFQLGPVNSVDIINPLNIVVFYGEVNTVVLLDNKLSEIERINFNTVPPFFNATSASNAGNNRLWVFDTNSQQLQLFDYRTNRETVVSAPFEGELIYQESNFNDCYVVTEDHLWQINIYGSLLSDRSLDGFSSIARYKELVLGIKDGKVYNISEETPQPIDLNLDENNIKELHLTQEFLYIYDGNLLNTFSLTLPKK